MIDTDLFGQPLPSPTTLRKDGGRRKIGYAARPGTGPRSQRCSTCSHFQRVVHQGEHAAKCERMTHVWDHDSATDIKPNAPACSEWDRKPWKKNGNVD